MRTELRFGFLWGAGLLLGFFGLFLSKAPALAKEENSKPEGWRKPPPPPAKSKTSPIIKGIFDDFGSISVSSVVASAMINPFAVAKMVIDAIALTDC